MELGLTKKKKCSSRQHGRHSIVSGETTADCNFNRKSVAKAGRISHCSACGMACGRFFFYDMRSLFPLTSCASSRVRWKTNYSTAMPKISIRRMACGRRPWWNPNENFNKLHKAKLKTVRLSYPVCANRWHLCYGTWFRLVIRNSNETANSHISVTSHGQLCTKKRNIRVFLFCLKRRIRRTRIVTIRDNLLWRVSVY